MFFLCFSSYKEAAVPKSPPKGYKVLVENLSSMVTQDDIYVSIESFPKKKIVSLKSKIVADFQPKIA